MTMTEEEFLKSAQEEIQVLNQIKIALDQILLTILTINEKIKN